MTKSGNSKNKRKLYFAIVLTMPVVVLIAVINLSRNIKQLNEQPAISPLGAGGRFEEISSQFGDMLAQFDKLKNSLNQSATTSADILQNSPRLGKEELGILIEKLKIESATSSSTSTATIINLPD